MSGESEKIAKLESETSTSNQTKDSLGFESAAQHLDSPLQYLNLKLAKCSSFIET